MHLAISLIEQNGGFEADPWASDAALEAIRSWRPAAGPALRLRAIDPDRRSSA